MWFRLKFENSIESISLVVAVYKSQIESAPDIFTFMEYVEPARASPLTIQWDEHRDQRCDNHLVFKMQLKNHFPMFVQCVCMRRMHSPFNIVLVYLIRSSWLSQAHFSCVAIQLGSHASTHTITLSQARPNRRRSQAECAQVPVKHNQSKWQSKYFKDHLGWQIFITLIFDLVSFLLFLFCHLKIHLRCKLHEVRAAQWMWAWARVRLCLCGRKKRNE